MFWVDEIAEQVIATYPDAEEFTCASGISPSGEVHMGNLREVLTTWFVVKALRERGKKVRFIFSWDNYDRLRKVPADIDQSFTKYIGAPLDRIPDPYGCHESWAKHFQEPFVEALKELNVDVEHLFQADRYTSGMYADKMIEAVQKRAKIYDVLMSFKTQDATEEEKEAFYPVQVYCAECGKDTTHIVADHENGAVLDYECKCGHKGSIDLRTQHHAKLMWKVDWPMRWTVEGVKFEPGGKDHSTEGGSAQVATKMVAEIYGGRAPVYRGYEFVGIKGQAGKMSSSKGDVMTPAKMLQVYTPEMILWFYTRFVPEKYFEISLDDDVLRMYHEFDRTYASCVSGEANESVKRGIEMALSCRPEFKPCPVSAQNIAAFAPIVNFDLDLLVDLLNKIGDKCTKEDIQERFEKISYWLTHYSPESISTLLENKNAEFYATLNEEEKGWVSTLVSNLENKDFTTEEMQTLLYEIPKLNGEQDKTRQKRFFEVVYNLLLGKSKGPRLYLFLAAVDKAKIIDLLKF